MKMLKMALAAPILLMGLAFMPSAQADMSVGNFIKFYTGSETEQAIVESYIGGVGNGLLWANSMLEIQGKQPLFCPESNSTYSTDQFLSIAVEAVEAYQKRSDSDKKTPVELVFMHRMMQIHPCD